jgi:acyl-CoA synthetase (AMP-forming)/AMP-acid ligase II
MAACARAGAAWLHQRGGDQIVFIGLNGTALPIALFASGLLRKPFVPLNYRLSNGDLCKLLARTASSAAIVDDDMVDRVRGTAGVTIVPRSVFEAATRDPALQEAAVPDGNPDIAVLLFTSGTTGEPKAAVLRHRHLMS